MTSFDLFDTGAIGAWDAPPIEHTPSPAPSRPATGNPMLDRGPIVIVPQTAALLPAPIPSVATVASVADWRTGVAELARLPRPETFSPARWTCLVADAQAFARVWAEDAFGLGWTLNEIFGCHPNPKLGEPCGVVRLLNGNRVVALTERLARIDVGFGNFQTYRRDFDRSAAVPLWIACVEAVK